MSKSGISSGAFVVAAIVASVFIEPGSAVAQTATNLKCDGCVNSGDIGLQAVKSRNIRDKAVKSRHLNNRSVTPEKLSNDAKPAGGGFAGAIDNVAVPNTDTVVRTLTLDLPGPGIVVVNSGGHMTADQNPSLLRCVIAASDSGLSVANDLFFNIEGSTNAGQGRKTVGSTRGFAETASGLRTYQLKCNSVLGGATVTNATLTAIYVPQNYALPPSEVGSR